MLQAPRDCVRAHTCVCKCVFEPRADTVMDDENEQINTKGLSPRLHPNLLRQVCTVSQQAETEEGKEREEIMIRRRGGREEWMGNIKVREQMERRRVGEGPIGRRRSIGRGYAGRD